MKWSENLRNNVIILALSGLIPFILTFSGIWLTEASVQAQFIRAYLNYAAVVVTFIGAVHWGVILNEANSKLPQQASLLTVGVLPSLLAWLALMLPVKAGVLIFCLSFPAIYGFERFSLLKDLLPAWYLKLRLILTLIVSCLTVSLYEKL